MEHNRTVQGSTGQVRFDLDWLRQEVWIKKMKLK